MSIGWCGCVSAGFCGDKNVAVIRKWRVICEADCNSGLVGSLTDNAVGNFGRVCFGVVEMIFLFE